MDQVRILLSGLVLLFNAGAHADSPRRIAITIDDLPGYRPVAERKANETLLRLASALKQQQVPAMGFVIGALASRNTDSRKALDSWAGAGFELGNHSWNHKDYGRSVSKEFWEGVAQTEKLIKPLR